jgi:hypothetical protein
MDKQTRTAEGPLEACWLTLVELMRERRKLSEIDIAIARLGYYHGARVAIDYCENDVWRAMMEVELRNHAREARELREAAS